jgi:hypothetical protein
LLSWSHFKTILFKRKTNVDRGELFSGPEQEIDHDIITDKDPSYTYTAHFIGRRVESNGVQSQWLLKNGTDGLLWGEKEKFLIDFQLNCLEIKINNICHGPNPLK